MKKKTVAGLIVLLVSGVALAETYTWVGGAANWDAAASWTPNIAGGPVAGDSIVNHAAAYNRYNISSALTPSISLVDVDFSQMGGAADIFNNAGGSTVNFTSTGTLTVGGTTPSHYIYFRGHTGGTMAMSLNNVEMTGGELNLGGNYAANVNYGLTALSVTGTVNVSGGGNFKLGTAPGVTASLQQVNLSNSAIFHLSVISGADRVRDVTVTGLNGDSTTSVRGNNQNNTGTSYTTLTINSTPSTTSTFNGGIINGTGTGHYLNLVKSGTGTQVLGGNNTYTGTTTVNAGGLIVDGSTAAASAVSVASDAWIGGDGTIGGNIVFADGAKFLFDADATLTANGSSVDLGNLSVASLIGLDSSAAAQTYTLIDGSATFDFTNVKNLGASNAQSLGDGKSAYFEEGGLKLVVIPEPASMGLLIGGAAGLMALRRMTRF